MCMHPTTEPNIHKVNTLEAYNLVAKAPTGLQSIHMGEVLLHLVMCNSIRCYDFFLER